MAYPPDTIAANKTALLKTLTDHPAHHNALATAINDIVGMLGTDPAGDSATLTARLTGIAYLDDRTQISALSSETIRARSSAGLVLQASGGSACLTIGASGGTAAAFAGQVLANDTTDCTGSETGSLQAYGGVYAAKQIRTDAFIVVGSGNSSGGGIAIDRDSYPFINFKAGNTSLAFLRGETANRLQVTNADVSALGDLNASIYYAASFMQVGTTTTGTGTATPKYVSAGDTYCNAQHANTRAALKLRTYDDGSGAYGLTVTYDGVTAAQEYHADITSVTASSTAQHRFYIGNDQIPKVVIDKAYCKIADGNFFYLRGDASTDGSVRISSPSSGTATLEIRKSGTWTTVQTWS
jgi:hypothetical protein